LGGGNPNEHSEFIDILKTFHDLGIVPNYTTNGMGLTDEILEATKQYCGGVAISCHPHLENVWEQALDKLANLDIVKNFHIIISDYESIDYFRHIYDTYRQDVEYFVLLPYIQMGRAVEQKEINHDLLFEVLKEYNDIGDVAFGANFYGALKVNNEFGVSLYEPEILSKYLDMKDMSIHNSSFEVKDDNC